MNKKLSSALLFGAFLMASTSVFVSCKDYDDDISELRAKIDANEKTINQINTQVTGGSIIKSVDQTATGLSITMLTTDGRTVNYTLTNGANGADGAPGTVWTINSEGYWVCNGEATSYKAIGEKGEKGDTGATGAQGEKGETGAQGEKGEKGDTGATGAQGEKGEKGDTGATGAQGEKGDKGDTGATGAKGEKGDKGDTGATGAQGEKGDKGDTGAQGEKGEKGDKGDTGATGAQGEKGDKGDTGATGAQGEKGDKGDTGNYYVPNYETGNFDLYDGVTGQKIGDSGISFVAKDQLTAVIDENGNLFLKNVKVGEELKNFTVAMSNVLRGFVFERDELGRAYIDGIPGIRVFDYGYNALTMSNIDSKDEAHTAATGDKIQKSPATYVYYHVNPANADFNLFKDHLKFVVKADAEYIKTRAKSNNLVVTPEAIELKEGILKVKLTMSGAPATGDNISVIALQSVAAIDTITSDYATIMTKDVDLRIAAKDETVDKDLRLEINAADNTAWNDVKTLKAWEDYADVKNFDITLPYDGELNLNEVFELHDLNNDHNAYKPEDVAMSWKFELVKNYKIGTEQTTVSVNGADVDINVEQTDQNDFVNLSNDGKLTAKVYDDTKKDAAIGRKPIIRVSLMDGNKIAQVAYARVQIGGHATAPSTSGKKTATVKAIDPTNETGGYKLTFECDKDRYAITTPEIINEQLYNYLGMSHEEFHSTYATFVANPSGVADNEKVGTVKQITENRNLYNNASTQLLQWEITNKEIFDNAGKTIKHTVRYRKNSNDYVDVTLTAEVESIVKEFNVATSDFIDEYWHNNFESADFNVAVPLTTTDEDPTHCVFDNNLNSPFVTNDQGILKLREDETNSVNFINYLFNKTGMEKITKIGDVEVTFAVSSDGTKLDATVDGATETIAEITNDHSADPFNKVVYSKTSDVAKKLLNTNEMYALFSVNGYYCNDVNRPVTIKFNGKNYFKANFVRPVQLKDVSPVGFIDAVDYGQSGSYVALQAVVEPTDWRGRDFASHENYWKFYGDLAGGFNVLVPTPIEATCNLNGIEDSAVPTTIELKTEPDGWNGHTTDKGYGFITYKNNGTLVQSTFYITVNVQVVYGWGTINHKVKIPVDPYHN